MTWMDGLEPVADRQLANVFNRTNRFYDVDSAATFTVRQLCRPERLVQVGREVDIEGRNVPATGFGATARLDQVSRLQIGACAVVERRACGIIE
jgi:hypothetical protein